MWNHWLPPSTAIFHTPALQSPATTTLSASGTISQRKIHIWFCTKFLSLQQMDSLWENQKWIYTYIAMNQPWELNNVSNYKSQVWDQETKVLTKWKLWSTSPLPRRAPLVGSTATEPITTKSTLILSSRPTGVPYFATPKLVHPSWMFCKDAASSDEKNPVLNRGCGVKSFFPAEIHHNTSSLPVCYMWHGSQAQLPYHWQPIIQSYHFNATQLRFRFSLKICRDGGIQRV